MDIKQPSLLDKLEGGEFLYDSEVSAILLARDHLRADGHYKEADYLRELLLGGYVKNILDTKNGSWFDARKYNWLNPVWLKDMDCPYFLEFFEDMVRRGIKTGFDGFDYAEAIARIKRFKREEPEKDE